MAAILLLNPVEMIAQGLIPPDLKVVMEALALGTFSFLLSIAAGVIVILRLPADAFSQEKPYRPQSVLDRILRLGANLLGWILILGGLALSIPGVPGQGILTIVLGLFLVDFPGKHRILRRLVTRPALRSRLDGIRVRFGQTPFTW